MTEPLVLKENVDTFTALSLFTQALRLKGLILHDSVDRSRHSAHAVSKSFKTYVLDDTIIAALDTRGIKKSNDPQAPDMMYFIDSHPQDQADYDPDYSPSNSWSFKLENGSFNPRLSLFVSLSISWQQRGVVLQPQVEGTYGSAEDPGSIFRIFKALTDNDPNAQPVAKEIAASDGTLVVSWTELGLGGLRKLSDFFLEFVNWDKARLRVMSLDVFNPAPHWEPWYKELYISEQAQPRVFKAWREQIEEFSKKLVQ